MPHDLSQLSAEKLLNDLLMYANQHCRSAVEEYRNEILRRLCAEREDHA